MKKQKLFFYLILPVIIAGCHLSAMEPSKEEISWAQPIAHSDDYELITFTTCDNQSFKVPKVFLHNTPWITSFMVSMKENKTGTINITLDTVDAQAFKHIYHALSVSHWCNILTDNIEKNPWGLLGTSDIQNKELLLHYLYENQFIFNDLLTDLSESEILKIMTALDFFCVNKIWITIYAELFQSLTKDGQIDLSEVELSDHVESAITHAKENYTSPNLSFDLGNVHHITWKIVRKEYIAHERGKPFTTLSDDERTLIKFTANDNCTFALPKFLLTASKQKFAENNILLPNISSQDFKYIYHALSVCYAYDTLRDINNIKPKNRIVYEAVLKNSNYLTNLDYNAIAKIMTALEYFDVDDEWLSVYGEQLALKAKNNKFEIPNIETVSPRTFNTIRSWIKTIDPKNYHGNSWHLQGIPFAKYAQYTDLLENKNIVINPLSQACIIRLHECGLSDIDGMWELLTLYGITPKKVHSITLSNNSLTSIPFYFLKGCSNLIFLSLTFNKIKSIDEKILEDCSNLTHFYLCHNLLTNLPKNIFGSCNNLREVDLSRNKINSIDKDTFKSCTQLDLLFLADNKLESINLRMFEHNPKLIKFLALGKNPCIPEKMDVEQALLEMRKRAEKSDKEENDDIYTVQKLKSKE